MLKWKDLVKKRIPASFLLLALISCSNAAQRTPTSFPTFTALPAFIPTQTLPALPSATAILQASDTLMPESSDVLDPQGTPVETWRELPIMPEAIAGQEFGSAYSFRANVTPQDVQDFYQDQLTGLGWSQPFDNPFDANGGQLVFRQEGSSLTITVTATESSVVVLLVMILA
jgi:hypothetical protein